MSISPDKSAFTACVLGEGPPSEKQAFDKELLQSAALREEAVAVSRIAHRLSNALKQESAVGLTPAQRNAIMNLGAAPLNSTISRSVRVSPRRAWINTGLATLGVAAALALGLYLLPGTAPSASPVQASSPIPSITLQALVSPTRTPGKPVVAPPLVAPASRATVGIPETAPPERPARTTILPAMAANPPTIVVEKAPSDSPPKPEESLPGKPITPRVTEDSLARPAPRPGE